MDTNVHNDSQKIHFADHESLTESDIKQLQKLVPLLSICIFFNVLNGTMFNVAIPDISQQFGLTPSEVSWVVTGYIIFFAIGSVTYGKLADIYSLNRLIAIGLILINAGSILGFLAQSYPMVIAARLLQSCGAGAVPALGMIIATRYFPPHLRGKVFGVIASTVAFGAGIGPVLGGFLSGQLHWRYLFLITLITLFTLPFFRKMLPHEEKKGGKFDILGAILMGLGVATLLLFITTYHWLFLLTSIIILGTFIFHINKSKNPFIKPSLFLNKAYRSGLISGFLSIGTVFGMLFMVPIMLRDLFGLATNQIGLIMFPGAMSAAIFGVVSGRLADKVGSIYIVYSGMSLLVIGYTALSFIAGVQPWMVMVGLVITYIGCIT